MSIYKKEIDDILIEFDLYNYTPLGFEVEPKKTEHMTLTMAYDLFLKYCNEYKI